MEQGRDQLAPGQISCPAKDDNIKRINGYEFGYDNLLNKHRHYIVSIYYTI